MSDVLNQVEAILFAAGKKVDIEYIAKLCRIKDLAVVKDALVELQKQYDERGSALMVVEEGSAWKLTTREKYLPLVQKIVPHAEFSKSLMETLAVIAWKQPALQADVIKIRTNKAYEHIKELTELGFITSEKYGRTKRLKVTQKFLDYFDLKGYDDVRQLFKDLNLHSHDTKLGTLEVYDESPEQSKDAEKEPEISDIPSSDEVERVREVNMELSEEFGREDGSDRQEDDTQGWEEEDDEKTASGDPYEQEAGNEDKEGIAESPEMESREETESYDKNAPDPGYADADVQNLPDDEHSDAGYEEVSKEAEEEDNTDYAEDREEEKEDSEEPPAEDVNADEHNREDIYSPEYGLPEEDSTDEKKQGDDDSSTDSEKKESSEKSFDDLLDEEYGNHAGDNSEHGSDDDE